MDNDHDPAPLRALSRARMRSRRHDRSPGGALPGPASGSAPLAGPFSGPLTVFRPGALPPEAPAIDISQAQRVGPVPLRECGHDGDGGSVGAGSERLPSRFDDSGVSLERHCREVENACHNEQFLLAPVGYFLIGFDSTILQANLAGADMLGIDRSHAGGARFRDYVTAPFQPDFAALFSRALNSPGPLECRVRMRRGRYGEAFQATLRASADGSGQACRVLIEPADGGLDALERNEERFRRIVHSAEEGIWEIDADARTTFVNPKMARMLGYSIEDMLSRPLGDFMDGAGRAAMDELVARRRRGIAERHDFRFIGKDGREVLTTLSTNPIVDAGGNYLGALAMVTELMEVKGAQPTAFWRDASYDQLTGLPKRDMFMDRLAVETRKADRNASFLALLLIDLDRFRELNERLGKDRADLLLIDTARRIAGCVRASDTLARVSPDQFAILLAGLDHAGKVDRIAQQVLSSLAQAFDSAGQKTFVPVSMGVALYPPDAGDIDQLMACADQALRSARLAGGSQLRYFQPEMQDLASLRRKMTAELREALRLGQFEIAYQPIVSLRNGAVYKAEALLRWRHPQRGLLGPAEFLPFAEIDGLIVEIGDWVFREVAQQTQRWQESISPQFQVSVNKSPVQFRHDAGQHQTWLDYLNQLGLPPRSIVMEITESALLDGAEQVSERLRQFRSMGLEVALDDFGTGYASLSHLTRFAIDYVKIDRTFIATLEEDSGDLALCEAIIVMAHKLGMKVMAEGVETKVQRALLVDAGCDYAQGYIFARPMAAAELEAVAKTGMPRFPH